MGLIKNGFHLKDPSRTPVVNKRRYQSQT